MEKVIEKIIEGSVDVVFKILLTSLIILVGFKLIKFLVKKISKGRGFTRLEKSSQTFILSICNIGLKILVIIMAITTLGIPMASIIAVLGSAGLALGLALQGGLSNIAGGVMIMFFKPFKVGDFIDTHTDSGIVLEINIFHTKLCTYDNKIVVIPNGDLSNTTIINASSMSERLLDLTFSVSYNSNISKVKEILLDVANNSKYLLKDKDITIALKEQGEDALMFMFRIWVKSEDYWKAKFDILETVKNEFDKSSISIPYKQLDVHVTK